MTMSSSSGEENAEAFGSMGDAQSGVNDDDNGEPQNGYRRLSDIDIRYCEGVVNADLGFVESSRPLDGDGEVCESVTNVYVLLGEELVSAG